MKLWTLAASALVLSACVSQRPSIDEASLGPSPKNYRSLAANYMRSQFFDPYSIRDAQITAPFIGRVGGKPGWVVCTKQNAKNRLGGYTGIQASAVLFQNGIPVDSADDASACANDPHSPWPEMMSITGR